AHIPQPPANLAAFARVRLTAADFDPLLDLDGELQLAEITPALFQALRVLEPYGVANPEPVFSALAVQITAPPRILKEKHVKLKLRTAPRRQESLSLSAAREHESATGESLEPVSSHQKLSPVAILTTPRCHPDGAAIRRSEKTVSAEELRTENRELRTGSWRDFIVFDALGWRMAERLQQSPLLAGDTIDIAFTIGHNDHPDYGGLELSLRDYRSVRSESESVKAAAPAGD